MKVGRNIDHTCCSKGTQILLPSWPLSLAVGRHEFKLEVIVRVLALFRPRFRLRVYLAPTDGTSPFDTIDVECGVQEVGAE
jgi:hypothetical protein